MEPGFLIGDFEPVLSHSIDRAIMHICSASSTWYSVGLETAPIPRLYARRMVPKSNLTEHWP